MSRPDRFDLRGAYPGQSPIVRPAGGPWSWERHGEGWALYSDRTDERHGMNLITVGPDGFDWNGEANRALIAAAPDLLALVEDIALRGPLVVDRARGALGPIGITGPLSDLAGLVRGFR